MRVVPALDALVELPAGRYEVGEPGEERACEVGALRIGRWPVVNARFRAFLVATGRPVPATVAAEALEDHPVTGVSLADAEAFCRWLGPGVRLPTGDEWEAAARGTDGRAFPWGETFYAEHCNCADSGWGWTVPVDAHPAGAGPFGTEQQAGNVWEWVADRRRRRLGRRARRLLPRHRVGPARLARAARRPRAGDEHDRVPNRRSGGPWREQF